MWGCNAFCCLSWWEGMNEWMELNVSGQVVNTESSQRLLGATTPVGSMVQVSQKTLAQSRGQPFAAGALLFSLLDSSAQKQALRSFPGVEAPGKGQITVVAYKPKRQRFQAMVGSGGLEEVESFIVRAVEGELRFQNTKGPPDFK